MINYISIFISYSWNDTYFVDKLDDKLQRYRYDIKRDIRDAEYAQNIKEFMKKIRKTDYTIIVLSDDFLKSENCMREIFEFIKDENYKDRIIPVILESAKDILGDNKGIAYTIYWKEREESFKEQLKKIDEESKVGYIEDLKHISSVKDSIGEVIATFRDMKMFDGNDNSIDDKIMDYIKKRRGFINDDVSSEIFKNSCMENEEYMAEHIFLEILETIKSTIIDKEKLAGILGRLLKEKRLSNGTQNLLKIKVRNSQIMDAFDIINETFELMLNDGMIYYTNEFCENVNKCESNVFANMLEILHFWERTYYKFNRKIFKFIRYSIGGKLNLEKVDLRKADLRKADLNASKLNSVNFCDADLYSCNLYNAELKNANLSGANLVGAALAGIQLDNTNLERAIFDETQIDLLEKRYILSGTKVYVEDDDRVLWYEEYCNNKQIKLQKSNSSKCNSISIIG